MAYFNKLGTVAWAKEIMAMIARLQNENVTLTVREKIERRQALQILSRENAKVMINA